MREFRYEGSEENREGPDNRLAVSCDGRVNINSYMSTL